MVKIGQAIRPSLSDQATIVVSVIISLIALLIGVVYMHGRI